MVFLNSKTRIFIRDFYQCCESYTCIWYFIVSSQKSFRKTLEMNVTKKGVKTVMTSPDPGVHLKEK